MRIYLTSITERQVESNLLVGPVRDERGLIFEFGQLFAQPGRFGAILCCLEMKLDCADAAHGGEGFAYGVFPAVAEAFELIGEIVLLHGVGFQSGNVCA